MRGAGHRAGFGSHSLCGNRVHGHEKAGLPVGPEGTGSTVDGFGHPNQSHGRAKGRVGLTGAVNRPKDLAATYFP